jgi:hypothetical protein
MSIINDMLCLCLRLTCVMALLGVPLVGCSDTDGAAGPGGAGGNGGDGGSTGTGGSAGSGGTGGCDPSVSATIFFNTVASESPLPDVRICEVGTDNCTSSNEDGRASLDFPGCEEVAWTFEKEGHNAFAGADVTDETLDPGPFDWNLPPVETMEMFAEVLDTTYPWTGTHHRAIPRRAGATYTLIDETTLGWYWNMGGPDPDPTETTSSGDGGFVRLSPGDVEVEFGGTATDCVASLAWPSERPNTIRIPVFEGFTTYGSMRCGEQ